MARTSSVYYIAPSAISIVPNCNGTASDLAVTISRGAKVRVYYPPIYDLDMVDGTYQEWTLAGRNRRLAEPEKPYTIYARLRKAEDPTSSASLSTAHANAYLVFAAQVKDANNEWTDPYILSANNSATSPLNNVTGADGSKYNWPPIPSIQTEQGRTDYWWVKLGTVSAPDENGQRTVDLDTGILGTEQYNNQWHLNPDDLPDKEVLSVYTERGKWSKAPRVVYTGPSGQRQPDGTLDSSVANSLGWTGDSTLSFTTGQEIDEPYHSRHLTRLRWIAQRLSADNDGLTDAELYNKLTGTTKGWEPENTLETSRAWHCGCYWECVVDGTDQEPGFGLDWKMISGKGWWIDFGLPKGIVVPLNDVDVRVPAVLMLGDEDVTDDAIAMGVVKGVTWNRDSGSSASDVMWEPNTDDISSGEKSAALVLMVRHNRRAGIVDCGPHWETRMRCDFICTVELGIGQEVEGVLGMG